MTLSINQMTSLLKDTVLTAVFFFSLSCIAQVEIDQAIELTGADGQRVVRNLEIPVNGTDAVNKDYVDTAVSASGSGGSPTMISAESSSSMNYGDAIRHCRNLTAGDFTDWYMPSYTEVIQLVSRGGTTVPNDTSANLFWLADRAMASGATSAWSYIQLFRLSNGTLSIAGGSETHWVRCVR